MGKIKLGILCTALFMFSSICYSATYFFVEPNALFGLAFESKIVLYKIQDVANGMQNPATGPDTIEISLQELKKVKNFLAKGDKEPGSLNKTITLLDGGQVTAGEYYLMDYLSYKYLNESKEKNENYLLEAFKQAEKSTSGFKGPMWDYMVNMLSSAEHAKFFGIVSSWGYSRNEWNELFSYLKSKGYIKFLPDENHIYSLRRTDYYAFGNSLTERKTNLIFNISQNLKNVVVGDGEKTTLVYADANQDDLSFVFDKLHFVTKGKFDRSSVTKMSVEFVLINGSTSDDLRKNELPQIFKVTQSGAQKIEEQQLTKDYFGNQEKIISKKLSCEGLFK